MSLNVGICPCGGADIVVDSFAVRARVRLCRRARPVVPPATHAARPPLARARIFTHTHSRFVYLNTGCVGLLYHARCPCTTMYVRARGAGPGGRGVEPRSVDPRSAGDAVVRSSGRPVVRPARAFPPARGERTIDRVGAVRCGAVARRRVETGSRRDATRARRATRERRGVVEVVVVVVEVEVGR